MVQNHNGKLVIKGFLSVPLVRPVALYVIPLVCSKVCSPKGGKKNKKKSLKKKDFFFFHLNIENNLLPAKVVIKGSDVYSR
jgi:hypothetical protein